VALDSDLTLQARRLALSAELTRRAARAAGERIDRGADAAALIAIARGLQAIAAPVERAHRLRFDPPYPGVTAGVQEAGSCSRAPSSTRAARPRRRSSRPSSPAARRS
jgi:hypothetical protein